MSGDSGFGFIFMVGMFALMLLILHGSGQENEMFAEAVEREYPVGIDVGYVYVKQIIEPIYVVEFEFSRTGASCEPTYYCDGIDECEKARCKIDSEVAHSGVMYLVRPWKGEVFFQVEPITLRGFVEAEGMTIENLDVIGSRYPIRGKDYVFYLLKNKLTGEYAGVYCPVDNTIMCFLWRSDMARA